MLGIGFNPRTHTGCDIIKLRLGSEQVVSIHAPTRGATSLLFSLDVETEFQSTHPHGVRRGRACNGHHPERFNPRTHTGCDHRGRLLIAVHQHVSIHAPTRGATFPNISKAMEEGFQSTHPHGVRLQSSRKTSLKP